MDILKLVTLKKNSLLADAEELWKRAECGFQLPKTREYLLKRLKEAGYEPKIIGRGSVLAEINGNCPETLLLRADMDALPTVNGAMHLCGHHYHAASLLSAAEIIKENEKDLKCNIKLLFQAAEETLEGAKNCIDAEILHNPEVDRAFMLHVLSALPLKTGTVIISSPGISAPGAVFFEITVEGRASHGSAPQNGIDALITGANIAIALENITAREYVGTDAVLTLGEYYSGTAPNVLPDRATLTGTVRTANETALRRITKRIKETAENIAKAYRAKASFDVKSACPPLKNDKRCAELAFSKLKATEGITPIFSDNLRKEGDNKTLGGSEDFAFIAKEVPSLMIGVAAGDNKDGYVIPLHHPSVAFDPKALTVSAAIYASLVLN